MHPGMESMLENNENLQVFPGWGAFMGMQSGFGNQDAKKKDPEPAVCMGSPLSPKNQFSPTPRKQPGFKRASGALSQQDDEDMCQKNAKRARLSHQDAVLLAMANAPGSVGMPTGMGAMFPNPLFAGAMQQQMAMQMQMPMSNLLLNPALLAATSGYMNNPAAVQQMLLSQALVNSNNCVNPLIQQQINNMIAADMACNLGAVNKGVVPNLGVVPAMIQTRMIQTRTDPAAPSPDDDAYDVACLALGKEFLPASTQNTRLCDCGMALCREIGYPHKGSIPFSTQTVDSWCESLGIVNEKRIQQIRESPGSFHLAYWHFREEHRTVDDLTGKYHIHRNAQVLPNARLQSFVDNYKETNWDEEEVKGEKRKPSQRMLELHNSWIRCRRAPTLEP